MFSFPINARHSLADMGEHPHASPPWLSDSMFSAAEGKVGCMPTGSERLLYVANTTSI